MTLRRTVAAVNAFDHNLGRSRASLHIDMDRGRFAVWFLVAGLVVITPLWTVALFEGVQFLVGLP